MPRRGESKLSLSSKCSELPTRPSLASGNFSAALERVVADLSDDYRWTWTRMLSYRDAADAALRVLSREGLIEQFEHPSGGRIWRVNGKFMPTKTKRNGKAGRGFAPRSVIRAARKYILAMQRKNMAEVKELEARVVSQRKHDRDEAEYKLAEAVWIHDNQPERVAADLELEALKACVELPPDAVRRIVGYLQSRFSV